MSDRVFCDREFLRRATEIYLENAHCVYASTRAPQDRLTGGPRRLSLAFASPCA